MEDIESVIRVDWDVPRKTYPPKVITLASGEKMVVREASREEAPLLLEAIRPLLTIERDYYDIVGARAYAELLGWYRYRVRNEFCLVGVVNGELVGLVNNRAYDRKKHISLHTIALRRGGRIGAHLFAAKQEHSIEILGADEVLVTSESPIGFRRWVVEWGLEARPETQHELGGAKCWAITREIYFKVKSKLVLGERPVPEELLKESSKLKLIKPDVAEQM